MKYSYILAAAMMTPNVVAAEGFDAFFLANAAKGGAEYYYVSLRSDLSFGSLPTAGDAGLRLRVDLGQARYDTNYDNTPGTGEGTNYRLLLSYGFVLSEATTLTVTAGVSHNTLEIRPGSPSSPDDESTTAEFVSIFLEHRAENFGLFQGLVEHDGASSDYASLTYMFDLGPNFKIGPTANYIEDGDYRRNAYGLSSTYMFNENVELKATAAAADQSVGSGSWGDVDYFELMLRTEF